MSNSSPIVSSNVIEELLKLYGYNENQLLQILATSPKTSVVRVNLVHPHADEAMSLISDYIRNLSSKDYTFHAEQHPFLEDILLLSPVCTSLISTPSYEEKEVVVDTFCGTAVMRGADIFAPGVLAAHPGMKKGDTVSVFIDLERKCRRGLVQKFEGKKYFVGNGIALYSRQELFENNANLKGTAIRMTDCLTKQPSFSGLDTSLYFPQNLPSAVVAHVLNPKPGDLILDMCAAPGGKTTHVASLLKNRGDIISIDKTQKKVDKILENCENLGLSNVKAFCYDSTKLHAEGTNMVSDQECELHPPFQANSFDKILLDPPCSGLGQRPQFRYVMAQKELDSYPIYQKKLIKQSVSLLKPGGELTYSTCTLRPQENEKQISWLLQTFPQMKLLEQIPFLGRPGIDGHGLTKEQCNKVQRFDWCFLSQKDTQDSPSECSQYDTIGFFIAKLIKKDMN